MSGKQRNLGNIKSQRRLAEKQCTDEELTEQPRIYRRKRMKNTWGETMSLRREWAGQEQETELGENRTETQTDKVKLTTKY